MIFPIWQKLYQSSHRLAAEVAEELSEPVTHTGTLDPMAQGILVLLTDEDRYAKGGFSDWQKTYEFSILWGVQTDSGDRLGMIQQHTAEQPNQDVLAGVLGGFPEQYEQVVPDYSARRWLGQSAFDAARTGHVLPQKTRLVEISALSLIEVVEISEAKILEEQAASVALVQGDFRQAEVVANWKNTLVNDTTFLVTTHSVTTSAGTYIRQLVQDIADQVGTPATTWAITRTKNGPYEQIDC